MFTQVIDCIYYLYEKNNRSVIKTIHNIFEIVLAVFMIKLENPPKMSQTIGKNLIQEYTYADKEYKILTKIKRGPNKFKITKIEDEYGHDVTKVMKSFLGPNEDWHRIPYTLKDFEKQKLIFFLHEGETCVIEDKNISLPVF